MLGDGNQEVDALELRLVAKVARMYHVDGSRQAVIADELHLSQARVSRLLSKAVESGIVTIVVTTPDDTHVELEAALEQKYGLSEAIVVGTTSGSSRSPSIAMAGARYLESTLTGVSIVAMAPWSATLLSTIENMRATNGNTVDTVAQLVGGIGSPQVQASTLNATIRLATLAQARTVMIPAPGLVGSIGTRDTLLADPPIQEALTVAKSADVALVGIGSLHPTKLTRDSGNAMPDQVLERLSEAGAVGEICLRYFDSEGHPVASGFGDRVIGIDPDSFRSIPRRVGIAGGTDKIGAIRGALRGGWLTVLITDTTIAEALVAD